MYTSYPQHQFYRNATTTQFGGLRTLVFPIALSLAAAACGSTTTTTPPANPVTQPDVFSMTARADGGKRYEFSVSRTKEGFTFWGETGGFLEQAYDFDAIRQDNGDWEFSGGKGFSQFQLTLHKVDENQWEITGQQFAGLHFDMACDPDFGDCTITGERDINLDIGQYTFDVESRIGNNMRLTGTHDSGTTGVTIRIKDDGILVGQCSLTNDGVTTLVTVDPVGDTSQPCDDPALTEAKPVLLTVATLVAMHQIEAVEAAKAAADAQREEQERQRSAATSGN